MVPISEKLHVKRLTENNLVIEDRFSNDSSGNEKMLVRATDLLRDDSIIGRSRIEKVYFYKGKCIYVEKEFDPNVLYTYLVDRTSDKELECPSCGYHGKSKEFSLGCPYCNTNFGIDFEARRKSHTYQLINLKAIRNTYICCVIVICLFLCCIGVGFLESFSVALFSAIMLTIPIYIPYSLFRQSFLPKKGDNTLESLVKKGHIHNENRIYNDLYVELNNYYYNSSKDKQDKNIIDYDIIKYHKAEYQPEYDDVSKSYTHYLILSYDIRKYYFINEQIQRIVETNTVKLRKNKEVSTDKNAVQCPNCGASYPISFRECEYCGNINNSRCEWLLDSFIK